MVGNLHNRVLTKLGREIVSGRLSPGSTVLAEQLEHEHGVSRSVVREVVRVLQAMGMLEAVKRVGTRILPMSHWNLYDPLVIRWRLELADSAQLRSLTELRRAVEPRAAELAATHRPDAASAELLVIAERMHTAGASGEIERFLELDIRFHSIVLSAGGNEMFAGLDAVIGEVLSGRTHLGLMPAHPHAEALQLHAEVANAIDEKRPRDAYDAMERMMLRTIDDIEPTWAEEPRLFF